MEETETTKSHYGDRGTGKLVSPSESQRNEPPAVWIRQTDQNVSRLPLGALDPNAVLEAVYEMDASFTIDQLADKIAAAYDEEPEDLGIEEWSAIHEALYRSILPGLDDAGYVRFHQSQGLIEHTH